MEAKLNLTADLPPKTQPTDPYNWYYYPPWHGQAKQGLPSTEKDYIIRCMGNSSTRVKADRVAIENENLCFYGAGKMIAAFKYWEKFEQVPE